ncbi:VOC family protein [Rhodococcus sp. SORGH_AS_0301]|uniref:VOC family protein n=1 Tax=Rhodococcus sp. SORGH_AS_0301 TaxID=3041780 RepID=UPI0027D80822|nr:VOC family protein [Rhodococcus sp. SORGH_AS_0301]
MTDGNGTFATEIHLVEWTSPRTDGEAYPIFWHIGLAKMAFVIPGAKAKLAELAAHDIRPTNRDIYRNYVSVLDPDGTCVSFAGLSYEGIEPAFAPRLTHVNPSVTDIGKAMQFYGHFLGLDLAYESRPCEPIPSSQGPGSDIAQWDSHLYTARGDARVHIDISELSFPPRTPDQCRPYQSATNRGIARIGLEVDDLDRVHDIVTAARDTGVELEIMAPPEEWDLGERGRSRVLCITDPDGIRLEFVEKPRVAPIDGCRNPVNPAPVRAY